MLRCAVVSRRATGPRDTSNHRRTGVPIHETEQRTSRHRQGPAGAPGVYDRRAFRSALVRPALPHDPAPPGGGPEAELRPGGLSDDHEGVDHRAHEPARRTSRRPLGTSSNRDPHLGRHRLRVGIPHLRACPRLPVRAGRGRAGGRRHRPVASHGHGLSVEPVPATPGHGLRHPRYGRHHRGHPDALGRRHPVKPLSLAQRHGVAVPAGRGAERSAVDRPARRLCRAAARIADRERARVRVGRVPPQSRLSRRSPGQRPHECRPDPDHHLLPPLRAGNTRLRLRGTGLLLRAAARARHGLPARPGLPVGPPRSKGGAVAVLPDAGGALCADSAGASGSSAGDRRDPHQPVLLHPQ